MPLNCDDCRQSFVGLVITNTASLWRQGGTVWELYGLLPVTTAKMSLVFSLIEYMCVGHCIADVNEPIAGAP